MSGTQKRARIRPLAGLKISSGRPAEIKKSIPELAKATAQLSIRLAKGFGRRSFRVLNESRHQLRLMKCRAGFTLRNALTGRKPLTVHVGDQTFLLAAEGAVAAEIWCGRYAEERELEFIIGALRPDMTFFDIGANAGLFSVPAAKKLRNGRVFAFEPSRWTYELLLRNARLNNLENIRALRSAVGDHTGEAILQVNAPGKDGLNTIGKPTHPDSQVVTNEVVPITTLDSFMREGSVNRVDVIKIDVEGAERLVFLGAAGLLSRPNAPLILYESGCLTKGFDYHPVESMWLLQKFGYSFFVIDSSTGKILRPSADRAYDAMVIAAKPAHPLYSTLGERAR